MRRLTGMFFLCGLFVGAAEAAETTTVVGDRVNARGKPTLRSEVVTQLRDGETVVFLREITLSSPGPGEPSRWAQIELPENTPVWISAQFVDPATKKIKADRLNVRSGKSLNHSIIGQLVQGESVKEIRTVGEWMEIETPKGAFAYVASDFLAKTKGSPTAVSPVGGKPSEPAVKKPSEATPTRKPPAEPRTPADTRPKTSIAGPVAPGPTDTAISRANAIVSPDKGIIAPSKPVLAKPAEPTAPTLSLTKPETPHLTTPPSAPSEPAASKPESDILPTDSAVTEPIMIVEADAPRSTVTTTAPKVMPLSDHAIRSGSDLAIQPGSDLATQPGSDHTTQLGSDSETQLDLSQPAIRDSVQGQTKIIVVPAPPTTPDTAAKRKVVRRGVVRRAYSIISPTSHALIDPTTGRLINYLYPGDTGLKLKYYSGKTIEVSGEESIDKRWPKTPLIEIRTLKPLP